MGKEPSRRLRQGLPRGTTSQRVVNRCAAEAGGESSDAANRRPTSASGSLSRLRLDGFGICSVPNSSTCSAPIRQRLITKS